MNYEHILRCKEILAGAQICVEFRNRTWFDDGHRDEVLQFEREHGVSHVVVDEPQGFASSIPWVAEVTAPSFVMVRLHGRNANTWEAKGLASSGERFNYLYSPAELNELADKVRPLGRQSAAHPRLLQQQLRGLRGAQRARFQPAAGQLTRCARHLPEKAPPNARLVRLALTACAEQNPLVAQRGVTASGAVTTSTRMRRPLALDGQRRSDGRQDF